MVLSYVCLLFLSILLDCLCVSISFGFVCRLDGACYLVACGLFFYPPSFMTLFHSPALSIWTRILQAGPHPVPVQDKHTPATFVFEIPLGEVCAFKCINNSDFFIS